MKNCSSKKLQDCSWPTYDPDLIKEKFVLIPIQVNGKLRATMEVEIDSPRSFVEQQAQDLIEKWLENKVIVKIIFIENKLINFVIK